VITRPLNSSFKTPPLTIIVIALFAALMLIVTSAANWMLNLSSHKAADVKAQASAFEMEASGTTADLRGIRAIGGGVAWASGSSGTVLRTLKSNNGDSGYVWQTCAMPPGAEKLDFRAIWAWDANDAVVMSSGPGDKSRLYKTTDGCSHWKLLYTNPDPKGFWDAMIFSDRRHGTILGDPVGGTFALMDTEDGGDHWDRAAAQPPSKNGEGAFAASNSSMSTLPASQQVTTVAPDDGWRFFGTGGREPRLLRLTIGGHTVGNPERDGLKMTFDVKWIAAPVPLTSGTDSSGVFSLAFRDQQHGIAAGGDYQKSTTATGTAAWTDDGGKTWTAATKPPHGYRSTVAWDEPDKLWITAGTNGADISRDDGRTWTPIDDGNWNALSLPWIVGPTGRIAKLVSLNLKEAKPQTGH
jgi:photosystem II stability/assembly factor-like uncharacterized protein